MKHHHTNKFERKTAAQRFEAVTRRSVDYGAETPVVSVQKGVMDGVAVGGSVSLRKDATGCFVVVH